MYVTFVCCRLSLPIISEIRICTPPSACGRWDVQLQMTIRCETTARLRRARVCMTAFLSDLNISSRHQSQLRKDHFTVFPPNNRIWTCSSRDLIHYVGQRHHDGGAEYCRKSGERDGEHNGEDSGRRVCSPFPFCLRLVG